MIDEVVKEMASVMVVREVVGSAEVVGVVELVVEEVDDSFLIICNNTLWHYYS